MQRSASDTIPIFYNRNGFVQLNAFLDKTSFSTLFVLIDQHTQIFCLPTLKEELKFSFYMIPIRAGEKQKNLKTSQYIWEALSELGADRDSILINLGGGVITDMGGFAAATFKRGMRFINIPTTLLGMVDAAIGGKTGVDFKGLKNQIGVFKNAIATLIDVNFLDTLSKREMASGLAEVMKYGIISSPTIWETIVNQDPEEQQLSAKLIKESVAIKSAIVEEDPTEKGIRKTLNFGHTLGHAVETHYLSKPKKEQLLHGEAIAMGMVLALHLSYQTQDFPLEKAKEISIQILKFYQKDFKTTFKNVVKKISTLPKLIGGDYYDVLDLLRHDKKNRNGEVNFILLQDIQQPVIDCQVTEDEIGLAVNFYNDMNMGFI